MATRQQAEDDAVRALEDAGLGVHDVPIDPADVARRLGVQVKDAELQPGVEGALVKEPGAEPVIYLNPWSYIKRRRFTCAHELGHWWQRHASGDAAEDFAFVDRRDHLSSRGTDPTERYANAFAAALLMPAEAVQRLRRRGLSTYDMSVRLGVSEQAMRIRLGVLGY